MTTTLDAVVALEFQFLEMGILLDAFDQVGGDALPPWLSVVRGEFRRLEAALESVSKLARVQP